MRGCITLVCICACQNVCNCRVEWSSKHASVVQNIQNHITHNCGVSLRYSRGNAQYGATKGVSGGVSRGFFLEAFDSIMSKISQQCPWSGTPKKTMSNIFRGQELKTVIYSQTFRVPLGYPGKISGYPAKKFGFTGLRRTY